MPGGRKELARNSKLFVESLPQGMLDSRRTFDVLAALPGIDPQRIGISGISGLYCTPDICQVLTPGQQDERLPLVPEDTVMFSAGDRAKKLSERLQENYGKIDAQVLIDIIKRPVAMKSNLHNAVFAPETLDMWYANAGKSTPACDEPYTHCNLGKLLRFYEANKPEEAVEEPAKVQLEAGVGG